MNFKNFTNIGLTYEKKQLVKYRDAVKVLPQGRITCKKNKNGRRQYYITIPNSDKSRYANIKLLPKAYKNDDWLNEKVLGNSPGKQRVHQSQNPYKPEELKHITSFNLRVRSKGELLIAEALRAGGFEFYYEMRLELVDEDGSIKVVYPDFVIVFPSGFIVYWEHKGRLDDRNYMLRDLKKTQLYFRNGIFEPHNLIVTTDGPDNMTDMEAISRIINGILMPLMGI